MLITIYRLSFVVCDVKSCGVLCVVCDAEMMMNCVKKAPKIWELFVIVGKGFPLSKLTCDGEILEKHILV